MGLTFSGCDGVAEVVAALTACVGATRTGCWMPTARARRVLCMVLTSCDGAADTVAAQWVDHMFRAKRSESRMSEEEGARRGARCEEGGRREAGIRGTTIITDITCLTQRGPLSLISGVA
eukprot:3671095-Rhodomonas_salina.3